MIYFLCYLYIHVARISRLARPPSLFMCSSLLRPSKSAVNAVRRDHPKVFGSLAAVAGCAAGAALYARRQSRSLARAAALQASVRVVLPPPSHQPLATVLDTYFKSKETIDAVRTLCVGVHAFQKLELLTDLAKGLGYEDVAIFIDGTPRTSLKLHMDVIFFFLFSFVLFCFPLASFVMCRFSSESACAPPE